MRGTLSWPSVACLAALSLLAPAGASAQIQVSAPTALRSWTTGSSVKDHRNPAIALDTTRNRYLLVFDREITAGIGDPRRIAALPLNVAGQPIGAEFAISSDASGFAAPAIAYNRLTDEFLVVFGWNAQVYAQRVAAATFALVGSALPLNAGNAEPPYVVAANDNRLSANRWFVAWHSTAADQTRGRLLIGSGAPDPAAPDEYLVGDGSKAAATYSDDGKYYVAWSRQINVYPYGKTIALGAVDTSGAAQLVSDAITYGNTIVGAYQPSIRYNRWSRRLLVTWKFQLPAIVDPICNPVCDYWVQWRGYDPFSAVWFGTPPVYFGMNQERADVSNEAMGGWMAVAEQAKQKTAPSNDLDLVGVPIRAPATHGDAFVLRQSSTDTQPLQDDSQVRVAASASYPFHVAVWAYQSDSLTSDLLGATIGATSQPLLFGGGNFDGAGGADYTVVRPNADNTLTWYTVRSSGPATATKWGAVGDVLVPGDYDGDGKTDVAVWRPESGAFYVVRSSGGLTGTSWGAGSELDVPVPGDFDGDHKTDLAVFRPGTIAKFYIVSSSTGQSTAFGWGTSGDLPLVGDLDGDGKTDLIVWRPSEATFYVRPSGGGAGYARRWGDTGDQPVVADCDGDGRADLGVYRPRPTGSEWYFLLSAGGAAAMTWGQEGDLPLPADFDGDGKADVAVWRADPSASGFYVVKSSGGAAAVRWGQPFDIPIAR